MKQYFQGDEYHTPDAAERFLLDKLLLNTRVLLMARIVAQLLDSRRLALKNQYDTEAWSQASYNILKSIEGCGGRFHITGFDQLRDCKKPVVIVSNHMSTLETMVFPCLIAPIMEFNFVVKHSLATHPIFGPVMMARSPITVMRSNPREDLQKVMQEGVSLLESGSSIVIFPQSTRTIEFVPEEFNSLGVKLAKKAGVQVLPVAIKTDFWRTGRLLKDLGPIDRSKHIHICFGKALDIEGTGKEEHRKIIEFIGDNVAKWNS